MWGRELLDAGKFSFLLQVLVTQVHSICESSLSCTFYSLLYVLHTNKKFRTTASGNLVLLGTVLKAGTGLCHFSPLTSMCEVSGASFTFSVKGMGA